MARTAPISGPLSFLIVALAAVFLNPAAMDRVGSASRESGGQVEEMGPPAPGNPSPEIENQKEITPPSGPGAQVQESAPSESAKTRGPEAGGDLPEGGQATSGNP